MPYCDHERFQMYCRFCNEQFEGDSAGEALLRVMEHERDCPKRPK